MNGERLNENFMKPPALLSNFVATVLSFKQGGQWKSRRPSPGKPSQPHKMLRCKRLPPVQPGWHGMCVEFAAVKLTLSETIYDNN
jgi:hypothetical protein